MSPIAIITFIVFSSYVHTSVPGLRRMAKCVRWLHEHITEPFSYSTVMHPLVLQKSVLLTPPLHIIIIKTRRVLIELYIVKNLPQVHKRKNNCVTVHS